MDLDEYEYPKKTVENPEAPGKKEPPANGVLSDDRDRGKSSKGCQKDLHRDAERSSRRSRSEDAGAPREDDRHRERSSSRHRSSSEHRSRDGERGDRDRQRMEHRDGVRDRERERERDQDRERDRERMRERDREMEMERESESERSRRSRSRSERYRVDEYDRHYRGGSRDLELRERDRELREKERDERAGDGDMEDVVGVATASGSAAAAVNEGKRRLLMHCSGGSSIGKYCQQGGGESEGTSRDWSALPEPALYLIMEKKGLLPGALADLISMGGVCKSWRSVFGDFKRQRFPSMPPFLISSLVWPSGHQTSDVYSFMEGRHLLRKEPLTLAGTIAEPVSVSHGYWLVQCIGCKCGVAFLADPFATAGSPTLRIDLPRAPGPGWRYNYGLGDPEWRYHVMTASPMSPECMIISLGSDFMLYCRPGDPEWSTYKFCRDHGNGGTMMRFCPCGLTVLEGKAYVLAENGELLIVDSLFPEPRWRVLTVEGLPLKKGRVPPMAVLAEAGGEILLIFHVQKLPRWMTMTEGFVVYRLDLPARKWVRVSSLGGNTVFLNRFAPPVTCHDAAKWGGASDCIYWYCGDSGRLLLFHVKDERSEYHPLPELRRFCEFMIPSFCYSFKC